MSDVESVICRYIVSKPLSGRSLLQDNGALRVRRVGLCVSKPLSGRSLLQESQEGGVSMICPVSPNR